MGTQNIDKVLARAAKLLAVQENRGASETEAAVAAEHLQRLLQDHNLSLSQVEHAGDSGAPTSKRIKNTVTTSVWQPWRAVLLSGIARNNFCISATQTEQGEKGRKQHAVIVGREINVNVTKMTYDYLAEAFMRVAKESYGVRQVSNRKDWAYFMDGAVSRVIERLDQRRREAEAESAQTPITGNGSGRELVLSDVYGTEADLNNDHLNGFPAGTTAQKRREAAERQARNVAEHDRLVAEGVDSNVAWYRAFGYSEEQAAEYAKDWKQKQSRQRSRRSNSASNFSRRDEAEYRKINSASYQSGRKVGASVGLDSQVGGGKPPEDQIDLSNTTRPLLRAVGASCADGCEAHFGHCAGNKPA